MRAHKALFDLPHIAVGVSVNCEGKVVPLFIESGNSQDRKKVTGQTTTNLLRLLRLLCLPTYSQILGSNHQTSHYSILRTWLHDL